jgi:hypothetical protein
MADAHRNGKRFIVRADELLSAFVELELAARVTAFEELQRSLIHEFAVDRHKSPTTRVSIPDARLSALALHLPTPRATG